MQTHLRIGMLQYKFLHFGFNSTLTLQNFGWILNLKKSALTSYPVEYLGLVLDTVVFPSAGEGPEIT